MTARVTVKGDAQVARRFRTLAKNAEDVSPAWPRVGAYLSRTINQQFVTEGKRLGTPWRPVKPAYRLWKIRSGFSRKTLRQTGKMMKTFTGRPMDIEHYEGNSATFGSSDIKATWHHHGTRRNGERVNPPRPIFKTTPDVKRDVRDILLKQIMKRK